MERAALAPSVMCAPQWQDIRPMLEVMRSGGVEWIHVDVMDGLFVPNLMIGTESIRQLRKISPIPLDLHLMIERPEDKLAWFDVQPGETVIVHVESTRHLQRVLTGIRNLGAHPVAALNPATPVAGVEDVLPDLDGVLLMLVNPGFAGQKMVPQTLDKIARLRSLLDRAGYENVPIEVDGNVSFENAASLREAGADIFVCGSASLFSARGTLKERIDRMRACVAGRPGKEVRAL